jgi:PmbA protein
MHDSVMKHLLEQLAAHPEWKYHILKNEWQTDFFRFYQSQTNYNISKVICSFDISIYKDKRSYSVNFDNPNIKKVDAAIRNTLAIIDSLPADPDFVDVETDLTVKPERKKANNILNVPLDIKIAILKEITALADKYGFELFGTFICNQQHTLILNSNGINKQQWNSPVYFEVKAVSTKNQVTVLQTFGGEDFSAFELPEFLRQFEQKLIFAQYPVIDVEPGEYDVVLAPRCIAEFMQYLSGSMSARSYDQKTSYFQEKLNQQVFPEYINITDDPDEPTIISYDYNYDGHVYQPLPLIDQGRFLNFMSNNYFSHKTGLPKNGNSGSCLVLGTGTATLESMIGSIKRGLYISSLHYMNFINDKETSVTGLTRDGTFLVEDGKITKVVNNLRFTEIIARIFQNISALENTSQTVPFSDNYESFDINSTKAPHVLVKGFNITSSTRTI